MKRRFSAGLTVALLAIGGFVTSAPAPAHAGPINILIYGPTIQTFDPGITTEKDLALAMGWRVTVASTAKWYTLTTADFQRYDAIVFGDPECGFKSTLRGLNLTRDVWSPAITGPIVVYGTDPVFHMFYGENSAGAQAFAENMLKYAAGGPGIGLYVSLSCYYANAKIGQPVPLLKDFGSFTVQGQGGCPNTAIIVAPDHPAMVGLTDADLSGWGCSIHELLDSFPSDFTTLAVRAKDGLAYVIARSGTGSSALAPATSPVSGPAPAVARRTGSPTGANRV